MVPNYDKHVVLCVYCVLLLLCCCCCMIGPTFSGMQTPVKELRHRQPPPHRPSVCCCVLVAFSIRPAASPVFRLFCYYHCLVYFLVSFCGCCCCLQLDCTHIPTHVVVYRCRTSRPARQHVGASPARRVLPCRDHPPKACTLALLHSFVSWCMTWCFGWCLVVCLHPSLLPHGAYFGTCTVFARTMQCVFVCVCAQQCAPCMYSLTGVTHGWQRTGHADAAL